MDKMNRALSIRSNKSSGPGSHGAASGRRGFSLSSLRGTIQPELSKKLYRLIKTSNTVITAHETAGRERVNIATQLSEWGEQTGDDAISDLSDKVGVVLSELGEQEDSYAHALDDARATLKVIRNTEKSVQPSRDAKGKIVDEIARLKSKEPQSARLVTLEQELVRAEAENLVAEAQLTNVTRQKLKEAYEAEFAATIERAEKQIILARHGRRLLRLLDDTPMVPGDTRAAYSAGPQARQILNDAEDDLREWQPDLAVDVDTKEDEDARIVAANVNRNQETVMSGGSGGSDKVTVDATHHQKENQEVVSPTPERDGQGKRGGLTETARTEAEGVSSSQGSRRPDEESSFASPRRNGGGRPADSATQFELA